MLSTFDEPVNLPDIQFLDTLSRAELKAADRAATVNTSYVYVLEAEGLGLFKIGRANNPIDRLSSYRTECPVPCTPIMIVRVQADDCDYIERYLHRAFLDVRHKGEWFRLTAEHVSQIKPLVSAAAQKGLRALDRELSRLPVTYDQGRIAYDRAMEAKMRRMLAIRAVPTDELILDRMAHFLGEQGYVTMADIVGDIDRKPRVVHEAMRGLLFQGKVALRRPFRHPGDGHVKLDQYRTCRLVLPDASCEWEDIGFGQELLISEPFGHFVSEFFGRVDF